MEYNENVEVYIMQRFGELKFSYSLIEKKLFVLRNCCPDTS